MKIFQEILDDYLENRTEEMSLKLDKLGWSNYARFMEWLEENDHNFLEIFKAYFNHRSSKT